MIDSLSDSTSVGEENETFFIRVWKPFPSISNFFTESSKWTIFASDELGLLQMVSELDIGRCASKEAQPGKEWTQSGVPARTLGPEGGWIGESHIDWRRERVLARTFGSRGGGL